MNYRIKQSFTEEEARRIINFLFASNTATSRNLHSLFEPIPKEKWVPKIGEEHWYIRDSGEPMRAIWTAESNEYAGFCNYFKSEKAAQAAADKIKSLLQSL